MAIKLTVRSVEAAKAAAKDHTLWDSELAGFGLRVSPKGRKTFVCYYRVNGQQRRPSLGTYPALRPEAARAMAKQILAGAHRGEDHSAEKQEARAALTVRDLCARYMRDHAEVKKRASSVRNDRRLIDNIILPALGNRKVPYITRAHIAALHSDHSSTPYQANRTLALLHKIFSLAERWGLRPDGSNPASNIDRYDEKKRERFLSIEEIERLWNVLHDPLTITTNLSSSIAAIKLLVLTGRRLGEILNLEWSWLDLDSAVVVYPPEATKTGALRVPLTAATVQVLRDLQADPQRDPRWVIRGHRKGQPLVNLQKPWGRIRKAAGLDDVRIHDLRHTFASVAVAQGLSLPLIGGLLGHRSHQTTARYAHLSLNPMRQAIDVVGGAMDRITHTEKQ